MDYGQTEHKAYNNDGNETRRLEVKILAFCVSVYVVNVITHRWVFRMNTMYVTMAVHNRREIQRKKRRKEEAFRP